MLGGLQVLRMEGMLVDEYGRCEDPIREMEGMLVDEYGRCDYCGHQFFKNLSEFACFHFYSSFPLISHLSFLYYTTHL